MGYLIIHTKIRKTLTIIVHKINPINTGDTTNHQDQSITFVNFNVINISVNNPVNPICGKLILMLPLFDISNPLYYQINTTIQLGNGALYLAPSKINLPRIKRISVAFIQ